MTISYTASVATCKHLGCFWKLLFRWKASIYKLIWPNMLLYLACYTTLSLTYRFILTSNQRATFEEISIFCDVYRDMIPVSFVLGFYVSIVVKRWWDQYLSIPWPDPLAVLVSVHVTGGDVRSRLMRRTIIRYANLCLVLTFRLICPTIKKKYPTLKHLVEAGYLLPNELDVLTKMDSKTVHPKYWVPIVWAAAIVARARREKIIRDDYGFKAIVDELNRFRQGCLILFSYDWISIPLVYTQVVTLAVYSYFFATLMATQYLDPTKGYPNNTIDLYVPCFAILQFFFFMGWLLVAESLVNPFGENDDDIEASWLLERNLQISYLIVDEVHEEHPKLLKDPFWDDIFPSEPPATKHRQNEPYLGSTWEMAISRSQDKMTNKSLYRSKNNPSNYGSRTALTSRMSRSQFETSSRKVQEKESAVILKSIKSRLFQPKFSRNDPALSFAPTEDIKAVWNLNQMVGSSDIRRMEGRDNPEDNASSDSQLHDYHSRLLFKESVQESLSQSWHGFPPNDSSVDKSGRSADNYNTLSRSGHHRSNAPNDLSSSTRRMDLLDPNSVARHQVSSTEAAPSTLLYTINEEKDQLAVHVRPPEGNDGTDKI